VDELPTDAAAVALAGPVAGDPVADPIELTELFDVDVDELAGLIALVTARWFGRLEGAQPIEAQALEHPADGGGGDTGFGGDRLAGQALPTQRLDAIDRGLGCRLTQTIGTRTAVTQAGQAFGFEAIHPFAHRARANAYGFADGLRRLPTEDHVDHVLSTERRQAGILMDVHSAPPRTVDVSTTSASSAGAGWTTY